MDHPEFLMVLVGLLFIVVLYLLFPK